VVSYRLGASRFWVHVLTEVLATYGPSRFFPSTEYARIARSGLRGWAHNKTDEVLPGGEGAGGSDRVRADRGPRVH